MSELFTVLHFSRNIKWETCSGFWKTMDIYTTAVLIYCPESWQPYF